MDSGIDLERLLQQEDASVEWKQNADIERVIKTLSAFANNFTGLVAGGWVVCGVAESKDEHGFPRPHRVGLEASRFKEVKGRVLSLCRERISPPVVPIVREHAVDGDPARRILAFYVAASPYTHAVRTSDGSSTYWVRTGSETVEARGELLRELRKRKQDAPPILERSASGASLEDIDRLAAEDFLKSANLPLAPDEYFKPGARVDAFSFPLVVSEPVSPGESRTIPTHLAILLFSREPTRFLPGAYALFSVYGGPSRTEGQSERYQATGPLPKLIRDLLEKLRLYTGMIIDKSASALAIQQNRPRYSEKALQEAVVNAFAHRDYESPEPVRITVFSDRIEVANPGGALPGMDADRLKQGSSPVRWRNPALASFLLRMGLAQNEGQGLPTIIRETLTTAGLPPEIRPGEDAFEIVLPAFRPDPGVAGDAENQTALQGRDGLILVSIGGESIRRVVASSLPILGLQGADILVDLAIPEYVSPDAPHWEAEAKRTGTRSETGSKIRAMGASISSTGALSSSHPCLVPSWHQPSLWLCIITRTVGMDRPTHWTGGFSFPGPDRIGTA